MLKDLPLKNFDMFNCSLHFPSLVMLLNLDNKFPTLLCGPVVLDSKLHLVTVVNSTQRFSHFFKSLKVSVEAERARDGTVGGLVVLKHLEQIQSTGALMSWNGTGNCQ